MEHGKPHLPECRGEVLEIEDETTDPGTRSELPPIDWHEGEDAEAEVEAEAAEALDTTVLYLNMTCRMPFYIG